MSKPNVDRNKEMILRRLDDPRKWSFDKLGSHYGIHKTTAEEIFNRDLFKYADKIAIYRYRKYMKNPMQFTGPNDPKIVVTPERLKRAFNMRPV